MARNFKSIKTVEKTNGNNNYWVSIFHIQYDHDVRISFSKGDEIVREYYNIHYGWKNAKRNMQNLSFGASKTLGEAEKLMAKKINELELKIK